MTACCSTCTVCINTGFTNVCDQWIGSAAGHSSCFFASCYSRHSEALATAPLTRSFCLLLPIVGHPRFDHLDHTMIISQMSLMLLRNFVYIMLTCHWCAQQSDGGSRGTAMVRASRPASKQASH